jgi:hypothetical protein
MAPFIEIVEKAQGLHLDRQQEKRIKGFHASQGGYCTKKVIIEAMFPESKKPLPMPTRRLFEIGHEFHDQMDRVLRHYARVTADLLWIQPWQMETFSKAMTEAYNGETDAESPLPLKVFGTPDFIGIDVKSGKLLFSDFKTSNERAFAMKKKGNRSANYAVQIGTYLPGIYTMFKRLGMPTDFKEINILYISKADRGLISHNYEAGYLIPMAKAYWEQVAREFAQFIATGGNILPLGNPPEDWMCRYCSMFAGKTECNRVLDTGTLERMTSSEGKQDALFT